MSAITFQCPSCGNLGTIIGTSRGVEVYECKQCLLCYLDTSQRTKSDHDNHWYGDLATADDSIANKFIDTMRTAYSKQLKHLEHLTDGRQILDLGCGLGIFLKIAAENRWETVGVEESEHAATFAKKHYSLQYKNLSQLKTSSFDVIRLSHVLEHVPEPRALLQRLHDLLKPSGILMVLVPNREPLLQYLVNRFRRLLTSKPKLAGAIYPHMHVLGFSTLSLKNLIEPIGFSALQIKTISMGDPTYYPLFYDGLLLCRPPKTWAKLRYDLVRLITRLGNPFNKGEWIASFFLKK